jgi:tetratricopeptide (TPR) repeat protein
MKVKDRKPTRKSEPAAIKPQRRNGLWPYYAVALGAIIVAFWAYGPALHGAFLFDDSVLPFALPNASAPLWQWIRDSAARPVLYATYWLNAQMSGDDPFSYHVFNVVFHLVGSALIFVIVRRLLEVAWPESAAPRRTLTAGIAASIFLLHPVQTEAVAYLAGRSESLSVMFFMAAFAAFLYRPQREISWGMTALVLALFACALFSKQHTIVLPAVLMLTDYWWNPGFSWKGIRANWRLYGLMVVGALIGLAAYWRIIQSSPSAGFSLKAFTWYQYFFTQCRALFVYIGQFVLPVHLDADWDFPISRTIFDHGAIVGLLALVALVVLACYFRRRFPLATYGFLLYLLLMAPTSSILPIADAIADRRLYLSMLGLLLIIGDLLMRLRMEPKKLATACGLVLLAATLATHARAAIWADNLALWQDTVEKSPHKRRVHFQLASAYGEAGRYDLAVAEYQKTAELEPPDYNLLVDWGLALEKMNRPDEALAKLRQAAQLEKTADIYTDMAMVYANRARWAEAMEALNTGEKIDPTFPWIYVNRAGVYLKLGQLQPAIADYRHALALDPTNQPALKGLSDLELQLRRMQMARP